MKFTVFNINKKIVVMSLFFLFMAMGFIVSCASDEPVIADDMTQQDYFLKAQEASDNGNYNLALSYYYAFKDKFPDDLNKNTWASYEIAFLYHKLGDNEKALELLNELLALYAQDKSGVLPKSIKELAETVKNRIETKLNPPQPTPEPEKK